MLDDLLEKGNKHFLGSLILKQENVANGAPQVLVIDGQQRLTTLSILIKALFDSFDADMRNNCKATVDAFLFYKKDKTSNEQFVKIEHSKLDREDFKSVITVGVASADITDKSNKIFRCYKYFLDKLKEVGLEKSINLFNMLTNIQSKILVVIDLADDDNEQSIFDTINSAGVRLSVADIIKNALFQRAIEMRDEDSAISLYKENWEDVFARKKCDTDFWDTERTLGRLKRDNLEILLHSVAVIEGFYNPEKDKLDKLALIYKKYINKQKDFGTLANFAKIIAEYAELYRNKLVLDDAFFGYKNYERRLVNVLNVCDVSTFYPYALYLYKKYENDEEQLKKELHKLETFVVRRFVCRAETKNYNKLCKEFIKDPLKLDTELSEPEINDKALIEKLRNIDNKQATLVLFWVELYRRHKKTGYYDKDELKYEYTLEHIMPENWEKYWADVPVIGDDGKIITNEKKATEHRESVINKIGNMTLLKKGLNSSIRNYEFQRKVKGEGCKGGIEAFAELGITKEVIEPFNNGDKVWDEAKINARSKAIIRDVLAIWSL